jgi:hypothetical protein
MMYEMILIKCIDISQHVRTYKQYKYGLNRKSEHFNSLRTIDLDTMKTIGSKSDEELDVIFNTNQLRLPLPYGRFSEPLVARKRANQSCVLFNVASNCYNLLLQLPALSRYPQIHTDAQRYNILFHTMIPRQFSNK